VSCWYWDNREYKKKTTDVEMFFGNKAKGTRKVQHFDIDSENKFAIDEVETGDQLLYLELSF
jgi:hypothetical protein